MENPKSDRDAILITGPTASGKSALALDVARRHNGVVINADSMQVYDTLRVVTARPSAAEMEDIVHHLYGHVPALQAYSTGDWLRDIAAVLSDLRLQGKLPVIIGGTGLYFKALTGGLAEMPLIPPDIRARLRRQGQVEGSEALYHVLLENDPQTAKRLKSGDLQRIIRALEVLEVTGRSISDLQGHSGPMVINPARAAKFVVLPDRAVLHARINSRFARMMDDGAVDEVRALLDQHVPEDRPVMKAIGVQQIADMLSGQISRAEAVERASSATRQYAKRQMTWFRNQMDESWVRVDGAEAAQSFL